MSFIASMAAAAAVEAGLVTAGSIGAMAIGAAATGAAGAALGAGVSAATGGDPAQGALMGGIGGLTAGGGAAIGGASAGAEAAFGPEAGAMGSNLAVNGGGLSIADAASLNADIAGMQGVGGTVAGGTGEVGGVAGGGGTALPASQTPALSADAGNLTSQVARGIPSSIGSGGIDVANAGSQAGNVGANTAAQIGQKAADPSFGAQLVDNIFGVGKNSDIAKYAGGALQGVAQGAGLGALTSGLTGGNVLQGMESGALTGGIGGAATPALQGMADSGGMTGAIGKFATDHPYVTAGGIGMLATPLVNSMLPSSSTSSTTSQPHVQNSYYWDPTQATRYQRSGVNVPTMAQGGETHGGGISDLGSYSDGGRLLKGPGDGVSDSIPAVIGHKQPARLAEGEFVVPARIVSELGNGSTDAGAKQLYAMMNRIQSGRSKTMGHRKFSEDTKAAEQLPA